MSMIQSEPAGEKCRTYTAKQAGVVLGVDPRLIYAGIRNGTIQAIRIGSRVVIPRAVIDGMIDASPLSGVARA